MNLESGYLYHVFNQGNNHQKIFFNRENYLYFLRKIHIHILPFADVLSWCLMPTHFHLMIYVVRQSYQPSEPGAKEQNLNSSIGVMLRSYTQAINKAEGWSGSLFRSETKAECINRPKGITPSFINTSGATQFVQFDPAKDYPQICMEYIHQNPVKANLCKNPTDWEFSSAADYAQLRNGKLINRERIAEYLFV